MLERHYGTSITTAGALITAGAMAADIGIAMIPGVGAAAAGRKNAGKHAAKKTGQEAAKLAAKNAAKLAAKNMALGTAKNGAQRAAALLPASDEQLQFEITAIFALAVTDIHGMDLDKDQALALVYGLSNERVSQKQIAAMATGLSGASSGGVVAAGNQIVAGRTDWSHWADTLADTLPGGAAQSLVRTMQTGQLDAVRENLSGKQQATIEYGVGALAGGAISGKAGSVGGQRGWAVQAEEARRTESLRVRCRRAGSAREMTRTKEVVLLRNVVEFRFNV